MRFFEPSKKFLDWLVKMAGGRPIIDCGCGDGHVTLALADRGARVIGLDLHGREEWPRERNLHLEMDANNFPFPDDCIVLFCRPCHGGWVEQVIKQARRKAAVVLYIGLQKNLREDLGQYVSRVKCFGKRCGKDEEFAWAINGISNDMARWVLVKLDYQEPWWMEDGGDRWINLAGGYCPKGREQVLDSMWIDDYQLLDWTRTGIYLKEGTAGWLDREGKFYPCASRDHIEYASLILHSTQQKLEDAGWTKVYGNTERDQPNFFCQEDLSAEQRNWLRTNGYHAFGLEDDPEEGQMLTAEGDHPFSTMPALHKFDKNGNEI